MVCFDENGPGDFEPRPASTRLPLIGLTATFERTRVVPSAALVVDKEEGCSLEMDTDAPG